MPVKTCRSDGKPGFRWGDSGSCYVYEAGNADSESAAKKRAIRQGIVAGASRKELETDLNAAGMRLLAEAETELQTEDVGEVEVLAVGGPINGIGSPPGGEYVTAERLAEIATATHELEDELKPYLKLGHSSEQRALREAGLLDDGEPSAGRFRNFRLSDDKTKIVADLQRVPKIVARLMRAGAFTRLSAELHGKLAKQGGDGDGQPPGLVIKGVALLGAKTPAVRTLGDVVKLYADQEIDDDEMTATVDRDLAKPDPWSRFFDEGSFVGNSEGIVAIPLQTFRELADSVERKTRRRADTRPNMPEITLDEKTQRELAAALGLEDEDELTPEKLLEAAKAKGETEGGDGDEGGDGGDGGNGNGGGDDEAAKELERRLAAAETTANETAEELRLERRRSFVEGALKEGKFNPGAREKLETLFDKDPDAAREFVAELPVNDDLAREFGSDEDGTATEEEQEAAEQAEKEEIARNLNISVEEVV